MSKTQNHIGILGLGARSTEFYLSELNKRYYASKGDYHTFPCILYNIDFNDINPYLPDNFDELVPRLKNYFVNLEKLPINRLLIPNITLHEVLEKFDHGFDIIHPLPLTIKFLKANNIQSITVFGTQYSMNSKYLTSRFKEQNIDVILPAKNHQEGIDAIRKRVYNYEENKNDKDVFNQLVKAYSANSIVVLACTELSIVHNIYNTNSRVLDMAKLQIKQALTLSH